MASSATQINSVEVRAFVKQDRAAVRKIALNTAMAGQPSAAFFDGDDLLADALTGYFTDHEPGSAFVAVMNAEVVGYIIGARDTRSMDSRFTRELMLPLIWKVVTQGLLLRRKNILFVYQVIVAAFSGRLWAPDLSEEYPATLHINLLSQARGTGVGGRLMEAYLDYLRSNNVPGVRMATMSEAAGQFFERQGFSLLYRSSRPYFHHILGKDVPLLIYGRRLL